MRQRRTRFNGALVAALMLSAVGQAADLQVRVDAREVVRPHVPSDLTLTVQEGPLTLPTEGGHFSTGPTSSAALAVLPWNEFVLLRQGA
jgi:uncharacterized lipoprotein